MCSSSYSLIHSISTVYPTYIYSHTWEFKMELQVLKLGESYNVEVRGLKL
jgi:hypothetical protein